MSKWNRIEHCIFPYITINWREKPLRTYETILELIGNTGTKNCLKISAELNIDLYGKGRKVTDEELGKVSIIKDELHGECNYSIMPERN